MPYTDGHVVGRRYILHQLLGEGGMGSVYRATDRLIDRQIALKRVHATPAIMVPASTQSGLNFRLSLAKEFKLLATLRHPNIVEVLDYGFDHEGEPYFTMELLENADILTDALSRHGLRERVNAILKILQALAFLHRRGILHRDLKPANVLLVDEQVKLLDFGLSMMLERTQNAHDADFAVGTLAYMPPEILMGGQATEHSDLYSVGVIAYEVLTGEHPFGADEIPALINQILYETPRLQDIDLSIDLANFILRLMSKDPADRYPSAGAAILALRDAVPFELLLETAEHRESFLKSAQFVGRTQELDTLTAALQNARAGKGGLWLISGESGTGKSRLLDELRTRAMIDGIPTVTGQAVREGGTPYHLWRLPFGWLSLLGELPESAVSLIRSQVPDVPALADVDAPLDRARSPQQAREELAKIFIETLAHTDQPLLLVLEDLHWSGSESLTLLEQMSGALDRLRLMVVGSFREDVTPHLPEQFKRAQVMRLGRLSAQDITQLSVAMIGENGTQPQVVDLLQRETEGNIFFVIEVIRALAEEAGNLDQIGAMTLPEHVISGGAQNIVQHRIRRLGDAERDLLYFAAAIGRQADIELLQVIAPDMDIALWLRECTAADLLEAVGTDWRFVHDRLRDAVLASIGDNERREIHAQIATAIEVHRGEGDERVAALAYHWRMARNPFKEAVYTVMAGEQAISSGAYQEALTYLERALSLIAADDQPAQVRVFNRQAEAYLGLGRYEQARTLYEQCLTIARQQKDDQGRAQALVHLGEIAHVQGDYHTARDLYQQGYDLYRSLQDMQGMGRTLNNLGSVLYDLGDQIGAKGMYQKSIQLSRETGHQWGMAGAIRKADVDETTEQTELNTVFDELEQGLARRDLRTTTQILSTVGDLSHERERTRELLQRALIASREVGDPVLTLTTFLHVSRLLYSDGYPEEALELAAFILHTPGTPETILDDAESLIFELEDHIDPDTRTGLWERGKTGTLTERISHALAWMGG